MIGSLIASYDGLPGSNEEIMQKVIFELISKLYISKRAQEPQSTRMERITLAKTQVNDLEIKVINA